MNVDRNQLYAKTFQFSTQLLKTLPNALGP